MGMGGERGVVKVQTAEKGPSPASLKAWMRNVYEVDSFSLWTLCVWHGPLYKEANLQRQEDARGRQESDRVADVLGNTAAVYHCSPRVRQLFSTPAAAAPHIISLSTRRREVGGLPGH